MASTKKKRAPPVPADDSAMRRIDLAADLLAAFVRPLGLDGAIALRRAANMLDSDERRKGKSIGRWPKKGERDG